MAGSINQKSWMTFNKNNGKYNDEKTNIIFHAYDCNGSKRTDEKCRAGSS